MDLSSIWQIAVARADDGSIGTLPSSAITTTAGTGAAALADRVLNLLTFLAYPLAFIGIVYTAYILLTSVGSPDGWTKAKKNLTYLAIGFFLIFGAGIFVSVMRSVILSTTK